jgi:hypothetical protein
MVGAGFDGSVKEYLEVSLGYSPGMVGVSAAVLIGFFCLFFFSIFASYLTQSRQLPEKMNEA